MHTRKFSSQDQIAFAKLSGDNNPLHIDRVAARRYIFGYPVVHGIHSVLWALDKWLEKHIGSMNLRSMKAYFLRPILLEEEVQCSDAFGQANRVEIELSSGGSISTRIEFEWEKSKHPCFDYLRTHFPEQHAPRALTSDEIASASGALDLCLNIESATALFPNVFRCISPLQVAVLLGTTRLVGVQCPGLHSLYSELDLSGHGAYDCTTLNYEVTKIDKRFGEVIMKIAAPSMTGFIKAFVRPAPQTQLSYMDVKGLVARNEFSGQRALVVGGSRGLGEVVGKLLCAGGAEAKITYYQGKEDAHRVVDQIRSDACVADFFRLDILNPKPDVLDALLKAWGPTHLYYFATPFIFSTVNGIFSPNLFQKFCDYYVIGFANTVNQLRSYGLKNVFYPSTVFIDELPMNMAEYVAAKVAGEMLCNFLEKSHREMTIYRPRLPRMATDQTASLVPIINLDPVPVMIEALRSFRDLSISR